MKVHFETTECDRCGGTGSYSYCEQWGSVCFGCSGSKVQLSAAGKKARKAYDAFCTAHRATKLASEVIAGDRIKIGGDPFRRVVTAVPSSTHAIKSDGTKIPYVEFTFAKGVSGPLGTTYSLGVVKDSYVTLAMTPVAQAEAFAYARTLKGCTVTE